MKVELSRTNWKEAQVMWELLPVGAKLTTSSGYYIKPEQNRAYHLDGMAIDLISGKILHWSRLVPFREVLPHEIVW